LEEARGVLPRLGIVLLNVLVPGLGLLRLGLWKLALAAFAALLALLLFFRGAPPVPLAALILIVGVGLLCLVASMWLSWRYSRVRETSRRWYAEWYTVLGAAIIALAINGLFSDSGSFRYRSFYIPSEAMEPSFKKGDRFIAFMGSLGPLRRGDLVLVRAPSGAIYMKRVAAIGGDRFAMQGGTIILNGHAVQQHISGTGWVNGVLGPEKVRRVTETFPSEGSVHEIYDVGPTSGDDVAELQVPAGAVYLLGDNRDNSADSRIPVEYGGLGGAVPMSAIAGRPYFESWGSSRPFGAKLSSPR
jgi:signal peptidase I